MSMGVQAIFLVGFMGSGKSVVGRELARRLGWEFVDLDAHIERCAGQTIPEIFRLQGEGGFRASESSALRDLTASLQRATVVALGGGAFAQEVNRELLRPWPSVFLDAPVAELWQRCAQEEAAGREERPLRKDREQFAALHAARLPFYRQASFTVCTDGKDCAAVCAEIERALELSDGADTQPGASPRPAAATAGARDGAKPASSSAERGEFRIGESQ